MNLFQKFNKKVLFFAQILRRFYWKSLLKKCGKGCEFYSGLRIFYPEKLSLGSQTILNAGVLINAKGTIVVGDHVRFSHYCQLQSTGLDLSQPYQNRSHVSKPIRIGDGVWVGAGAVILSGVTIGEGAVVAAGSVVNKDVEPFTLVVGAPARFIKKLTP